MGQPSVSSVRTQSNFQGLQNTTVQLVCGYEQLRVKKEAQLQLARVSPSLSRVDQEPLGEHLVNPQYHTSTTCVETRPPPGFPPPFHHISGHKPLSVQQRELAHFSALCVRFNLRQAQPMMQQQFHHPDTRQTELQFSQTRHYQRDSPRPWPNMATSSAPSDFLQGNQRQRSFSPQDLSIMVERAARRNGSQGAIEPMVNIAQTHEPQFPQNILGIRRQSPTSPLIPAQYPPTQSILRGLQPPLVLQSASTRGELATRQRNPVRALSHGLLGLDSNMPSQLPRNPQEAAGASLRHSTRIRAMQRSLASDPNVIVSQASGASTQLVAIGPPLTGHGTTSSTTLPSVLTPYARQPIMNYKEGLMALIDETGPLLLRLTQLEPQAVSVVLYDDIGRPLNVSEGLILDKNCDLKALVTIIQGLLDEHCRMEHTHHSEERLIIQIIEVRAGTKDGAQGFPPIKGRCVKTERGKFASWIRWATRGEMEKYWEGYRIMLQTQAPKPGTPPVSKPIFRVRTVRQVVNPSGSYKGGHEFFDVSNIVTSPPTVRDNDDRSDNVGVALQTVASGTETSSQTSSSYRTSLSSNQSPATARIVTQSLDQLHVFGGDAAASSSSFRNDRSVSDGGDASGPNIPKETPKPVDPTKNWGYYQRMGGDPRMHKLYDLSHVPFDVDVKEPLSPELETFSLRDLIVRIQEDWSDNGDDGSITPKLSDGPFQTPISDIEKAWREHEATRFEAAISFEDDNTFFPNYDTQIPDAQKIAASPLIDLPQQQDAKGKDEGKFDGKETETNDFFNSWCAPDGSQDHPVLGNFKSPDGLYGGLSSESSSEAVNYDGKTMHAPDSYIGYSVLKSSQDQHTFGHHLNNFSMMQSPMSSTAKNTSESTFKSPHTKASMNVHAPAFSNYKQFYDCPQATAAFTTYMPPVTAFQTVLAVPSPYGRLIGQNRSGAAGDMRESFTTMTSTQAPPLHTSSLATAPYIHDLNSRADAPFHPQQKNSSLWRSPEKDKRVNIGISPVPGHGSPMFNNNSSFSVQQNGSPEKSTLFSAGAFSQFTASKQKSPERPKSQQGRNRGQRLRSPEKFILPGQQHATPMILRRQSPEKSKAQQGFGPIVPYAQNVAAASTQRHPPLGPSSAQQGLFQGLQYGQKIQYGPDLNNEFADQRSNNIAGQGSMLAIGQVSSDASVQGAMQSGGQFSGRTGDQAPTGGTFKHTHGDSWTFRGEKMI